jgi:hypothetical protein
MKPCPRLSHCIAAIPNTGTSLVQEPANTRANSIYDSFHHAVVIHSTNDVLVERNVAYDINSHTFVIEIGHEERLSGIHHSGHQSGVGAVPSRHRSRRTRGVPRPW